MPRKLTQDEFEVKCHAVHGDLYDLSKADYKGSMTPVILVCKVHGEFEITPNHIISYGAGCHDCANFRKGSASRERAIGIDAVSKQLSEKFGTKFALPVGQSVHGMHSYVNVVCDQGHPFRKKVQNLLQFMKVCPVCYGRRKKTTEQYVEEVKQVHQNRYDYSETEYRGDGEYIEYRCPVHGLRRQIAGVHLRAGCAACAGNEPLTTSDFVARCEVAHAGKGYDFTDTIYTGRHAPVSFGCPKHGTITMQAGDLASGHGCAQCAFEEGADDYRLTTSEFVYVARLQHGDKYDYSKSVYTTCHDLITIICPFHGEFKQVAHEHLRGKGCRNCGSAGIKRLGMNRLSDEEQRRFDVLIGDVQLSISGLACDPMRKGVTE